MSSRTDIFAAFGEALYLAQSMETGMRIFYWLDKILPESPPGRIPHIDFTAEPLGELKMNSLGGFIRRFRRELQEEGTVDLETRAIMRRLEQAVEDRNLLVHSFWWDRAQQFATPQGRLEIFQELSEVIARFRYYNQIIRHMVLLSLEHYGFTPDQFTDLEFQSYLMME